MFSGRLLLSSVLIIYFLYSYLLWHESAGSISRSTHLSEGMAALQPLKFLTVNPRSKHTATIIFVHGLGDSGHGWKPVADVYARDNAMSHIKWILPHAHMSPVTANMGMEMPSWFDIFDFDFGGQEDEAGMLRTAHALNQLISAEIDAGIPANRVVLGGFSQGGAMSLLTGLTTERKLGGLVVLSGWLPLATKFKAMASPHIKSLPIFWGHGKRDPLVKYPLGVRSVEFLKSQLGVLPAASDSPQAGGICFNSYDGLPHSTNNEELRDLLAWLKKVLPGE
ncbi:hypothetical protein AcV5_001435 [Taiwanofungus camphoratus]|nr:hypothetical protein AcV5_001435 [Antrodia cinnamomea]